MSSPPAPWRWSAVVMVSALAAASCGGGSSSSHQSSVTTEAGTSLPTAATTETSVGAPAGETLTLSFDDGGRVTKDSALAAAVLAFGPIDGVPTPTAGTAGFFSTSGPYRWLAMHWDEFDPSLQQAVTTRLSQILPSAPGDVGNGATQGLRRTGTFSDGPGTAAYRTLVDADIASIASLLGRPLKKPTAITLSNVPSPDGAYAQAAHWALGGAEFPGCWITIYPKASSAGANLGFLLAHEVFHCFQDEVLTYAQWKTSPGWVTEGQATWVGLEVGGAAEVVTDETRPDITAHWRGWLQHPEISLTGREYDAVGFYSVLKDAGVNVWSVLDGMLGAGGSDGSYQAAVAGSHDSVAQRWASSLFRDDKPCCAWNLRTAIGPTSKSSAVPPIHTLGLDNGGSTSTDQVASFAAGLYLLDTRADVVSIRTEGTSRLADAASLDLTPALGSTTDLCTRSGGCACPDGSTPRPTTSATGPVRWAIGGGESAALGTAVGTSLEEWCRQPATTTTVSTAGLDACSLLTPEEVLAATGYTLPPLLGTGVSALESCGWVSGQNPPVWAVQLQLVDPPLTSLPGPDMQRSDCAAYGGGHINGPDWYACLAPAAAGAGGLFLRTVRGSVILTTTETLSATQGEALVHVLVHHLLGG